MNSELINVKLEKIDELIKKYSDELIDIFCNPCKHGNTINKNRLVGIIPKGFKNE